MRACVFAALIILPLGKGDASICSTSSCEDDQIPADCQFPKIMCVTEGDEDLMLDLEIVLELESDPEYMQMKRQKIVE